MLSENAADFHVKPLQERVQEWDRMKLKLKVSTSQVSEFDVQKKSVEVVRSDAAEKAHSEIAWDEQHGLKVGFENNGDDKNFFIPCATEAAAVADDDDEDDDYEGAVFEDV